MIDLNRPESALSKEDTHGPPAWREAPLYQLVIIAGTIFVVEALIMALFSALPPIPPLIEMFIDSLSLVTLTFPVLYFFIFRPLVRHIAERRRAEEILRKYQERLEELVEERTADLQKKILELNRSKETIRHACYHDSLTGLPNRLLLIDRIDQALARGRRERLSAAVLLLDLDRFKNINDTLGHAAGDELLKTVAERLRPLVRESDTVSRQGGDEFAVFIQDFNKTEDVIKVTEKTLSIFKEPFNIMGRELSATASIGISVYPDDGGDAETLIKNADAAMYRAKEEGGNSYRLFSPDMNEIIARKLMIENKLRKAVEDEEFLVYYQPQVDIDTMEAVGMEALVRLRDPVGGLVLPGQFIPLAEETGLVVPIGEWVLRTACAQNKSWQDRGLKPVSISVNLSARQFRQRNFVDMVTGILEQTGLDPKYLELELTESIIIGDVESNMKILDALKAMGIRLAIDDFGTGYSSLEYLRRMPIDRLKIAQSFVAGITVDPDDATIAATIISMGHSLKTDVIAEGVETVEQLRLLRKMQCDKIQGFLVSRPVPSKEAEDFLKNPEPNRAGAN